MQSTIVFIDKNIYKLVDDEKQEENNDAITAEIVEL
jgi:hypothetical protein